LGFSSQMALMTDCSCDTGKNCIAAPAEAARPASAYPLAGFSGRLLALFGAVLGVVILVVVLAEWLGLIDPLTDHVPWPFWLAAVLAGGYPIFRTVLIAALKRRITSHTLMTAGLIAAIAVGAWPAGVVVVFFMRLADFIEHFTATRARSAVRDLTAMAPETARVERNGTEIEVPVGAVRVGGWSSCGRARRSRSTARSSPARRLSIRRQLPASRCRSRRARHPCLPPPASPRLGSLRLRATGVGADTTFGRVIKLVEEADRHRAEAQRLADRFGTWYLPIVGVIAAITFLVSGNALATAAVLMVACSCSFALATPVAMIASIGASARRGLLIKGGKYLEALAKANVVLIDKNRHPDLGPPADHRCGRLRRHDRRRPSADVRRVRRALFGAPARRSSPRGGYRTRASAARI
jgi:P-type Cu+ transporter